MEKIITNLKNIYNEYIFIDISNYDVEKCTEYIDKAIKKNKIIFYSKNKQLHDFIFENFFNEKYNNILFIMFHCGKVSLVNSDGITKYAFEDFINKNNELCCICYETNNETIWCPYCNTSYCRNCFSKINNCSICRKNLQ